LHLDETPFEIYRLRSLCLKSRRRRVIGGKTRGINIEAFRIAIFIDVRDQKGNGQSNLGQFPREAGARGFSSFYPSKEAGLLAECLHPEMSSAFSVLHNLQPSPRNLVSVLVPVTNAGTDEVHGE
jgi:hypothetical protein